jgi:hypothetical protein
MITARYSQPCSVQMNVMSVTQDVFGLTAVKSRPSRFGAIGKSCFESVVLRNRRRVIATSLFSPTSDRDQPVFLHQPGHPLATNFRPGSFEVLMDARAPIASLAHVVRRGDPLQ